MATRRSPSEIAEFHRRQAEKHQAEAERRLSVAADAVCEMLYDAEKALRALAARVGSEAGNGLAYRGMADGLEQDRINRWADLKAQKDRT